MSKLKKDDVLNIENSVRDLRADITKVGASRNSYLHFYIEGNGLAWITDARKIRTLRNFCNQCLKERGLK